jgi:hypothetical protein
VQQLKLPLMKKTMLMAVEVIYGWSLSLRFMMHRTKALEITIGSHWSKVIFNVIPSSTNRIVIGLFQFILHNLQMDWHKKSFHFEVPKEETWKCKALPIGWFGENQDCPTIKVHSKIIENLIHVYKILHVIGSLKVHKDPNTQSFCLWEDEISCKLLKKEMHSWYVFF